MSLSFDRAEAIIVEWLQHGDFDAMLCLNGLDLTELPDSFPYHSVRKLDCSHNKLTSLSLPVAIWVYCYHNRLTSLSLPVATYVICSNNLLTSLSLPEASLVWCFDNQLTSLTLPMATKIKCQNNQLSSISCSSRVKEIQLHNNRLEYLLSGLLTDKLKPLIDKDRSSKCCIVVRKWAQKMRRIIRRKKAIVVDRSGVFDGIFDLASLVTSYI